MTLSGLEEGENTIRISTSGQTYIVAVTREPDPALLAAEQGEASAQFNLGYMYATGRGVAEDNTEAVRWYRLAAEQGHAGARRVLRRLNR